MSVIQTNTMPLISLLAFVDHNVDKPRLPWTNLIREDLSALAEFHGSRLAELGRPDENASAWAAFIKDHPRAFTELVQQYGFVAGTLDLSRTEPSVAGSGLAAFSCTECATAGKPVCFATEKALKAHSRRAHDVRNPIRVYLDASGRCPVCKGVYGSRTRCLAHATEKSCRGKTAVTCRSALEAGHFMVLPAADVAKLDIQDRHHLKTARALGHTQPVAIVPAKRPRVCGPQRIAEAASLEMHCLAVAPRKRLHVKTTCSSCTVKHVTVRPARRLRWKTTLPNVAHRHCLVHQVPSKRQRTS